MTLITPKALRRSAGFLTSCRRSLSAMFEATAKTTQKKELFAKEPTAVRKSGSANSSFIHPLPILTRARRGLPLPQTCTWSCVKGSCCALAGSAKTDPVAIMRKVSVFRNLIAALRGCRRLREIYGQILPHTSCSQSAACASERRRHEFSGRSQLRGIGLRHAVDVAVLDGATTSPMACFLVVATRHAAVRNLLPSWLNPELPLPLSGAGEEGIPQVSGFGKPIFVRNPGTVSYTGWPEHAQS